MKKIAILQSNYIPWKGYFDLINMVDEFIIYDDVQFTKNDWRNRNQIKTQNGVQWLTIPVRQHGLQQLINETKVVNQLWRKKHWNAIITNYSKAKCFSEFSDLFCDLYFKDNEESLSKINFKFIKAINRVLGIKTNITRSGEYKLEGDRMERLVSLCRQTSAREYVSGPAAKGYIQEELFEEEGIKLSWMDYSGYPEYSQLFDPFEHGVSVLDLIFNEGPDAKKYMKSF